jgi:ATP-binding cassette, subfamily B, bacterial PglK
MLSSFRQLWSIFTPEERLHTVVLFVLTIIGALFEMVGVGAIPVFIGLLADPTAVDAYPAVARGLDALGLRSQRDLVIWGGGGLFALFAVKNAYGAGLMYLQGRFVFSRFISLSTRLFDGYLRAPYTFHLQRNSAELLRNTNQETVSMVLNVFVPALLLLTEALVVLSVVALILIVEPLTSLLAFTVLGGAGAVFWMLVRRRSVALGLLQQRERRWMIQTVNEGLGGIKDTKVLNRESHFLRAYRRSVEEYARTARFNKLVGQLPRPFIESVAVGGLLLVGFVFVAQGRPVESIVPTLTLFGVAIARLMPSMQRIMTAMSSVRFNCPSLDVVNSELAAAGGPQVMQHGPPRATAARQGARQDEGTAPLRVDRSVELTSVNYTYPGQQAPALVNVSVSLAKHQMIGFVGASGAGKSTLVDVILGLLTPDSGRILVDGVDIHAAGAISEWQRQIGYIPQAIFLADTTIRRNVAFGLDDDQVDDAAVWAALEAAQLADYVRSLEEGLDSLIGERGIRISGGQRQRIGIARALYGRPSLLVMDEATSALDNRTEREFIQAVERLRLGATVVVVAHRLSTVRNCDYLYVLDRGRVVDHGSYTSLQLRSTAFRDIASIIEHPHAASA